MPGQIILDSETVGVSVAYYRDQLRNTRPDEFEFLTADQQALIRYRLLTSMKLIRDEAEEHLNRKRFPALKPCIDELERCSNLLRKLDATSPRDQSITLRHQVTQEQNPACPLKYTFLLARLDLTKKANDPEARHFSVEAFKEEVDTFAQDVRTLMESFDSKEKLNAYDKSASFKKVLGRRNDERRLWWVWGTSIYGVVDQLLTHDAIQFDLSNLKARNDAIGIFAPTFGIISWSLYFFRGILDVGEAAHESWHHYRPDNIRSQVKLQDAGGGSRFWAQLKRRKFSLLNDFLWGTANALCYFMLVKDEGIASTLGTTAETLAQWNYILTFILLIGDMLMTLWRYIETREAHQKVYANLKQKEDEARQAILALEGGSSYFAGCFPGHQHFLLDQLVLQIQQGQKLSINGKNLNQDDENYQQYLYWIARYKEIQEARQKEKFDWTYQRRNLLNELTFTLNLMAGFSLMCSFFYQGFVSSLGQAIMGVVGASFCFLATIAFNLAIVLIERNKVNKSIENRELQIDGFLEKFQRHGVSVEEQKLLFLQMKSQVGYSEYERAVAAWHSKCWPLKTVVDCLSPAIFFFMVHFILVGATIPPAALIISVIALCAAIIYVARRLMKSWEPPKPAENDPRFFPTLKGNVQLEKEFNGLLVLGQTKTLTRDDVCKKPEMVRKEPGEGEGLLRPI
ncbi:MAG: hypothetical protein NTW08_07220 [Gammaproteobacteria bacterium]|nr:hypothetical protein [Gammaproteobacteria bacterium]